MEAAKDMFKAIVALITLIVVVLLALAASYGICALFVWLIALCFGFEFTWKIAAGVWLALWLVSLFVKGNYVK